MWHKYPILSPERTHGNSVTQMQGQVTLSEEEFLFINCTYSTTGYPTLFWYVQYPGEGPQLLLKVTTANNKGSSRGFEATYDKGTTSFHLRKASVQESDSAVYYCALGDTVAQTTRGAEHKLWEAGGWLLSVSEITHLGTTSRSALVDTTHKSIQINIKKVLGEQEGSMPHSRLNPREWRQSHITVISFWLLFYEMEFYVAQAGLE